MKKSMLLCMLLIISVINFSCAKDDDSNNMTNLRNVEIILTKGKASYIEINPFGQKMDNDLADRYKYQNVEKVSLELPEHTEHFNLNIHGDQNQIEGYMKINGKESLIQSLDWNYNATIYLSDFQ